ncbi:hypothetical protein A1O3_03831 [Capronia epimyces CBS 606.96]|uniref:Uncharacterized protein n=1 Tax=Capronia epimyces CBS 606.96 TaxID=1182542 RepID=W9Y271_9EURO|nr:uncharacterized protein A1O3_03831 [Capronia epimyces CBS 606.96]EXJ86877.1 hypothetical protein A1O3_03831 [Capronia epimyces CBS 606.96]
MNYHPKHVSPFELIIAFANCVVWLVAAYFLYRVFQERRHLQAKARARAPPQGTSCLQVDEQREQPSLLPDNEGEVFPASREWEHFKARFGGGMA